jgi:sporulation protein YlmC with PRC-barrel domain
MENKQIPKREEKLWSEIKSYQVATNNARILGVLDELIINEKTGKIVDIAVKVEAGRNIATLIETAALNYRLKLLGQDATVEFESRLKNTLKRDI